MEQLPLTFVQSTVEADIQECFTPAFNFTKLGSSNGRLAFTDSGKIYWLPDNPMAMLDQGWVINASEVAGCEKYGITGFTIRLNDGKELRFSNVGGKMREDITAAIEAHKGDVASVEAASEVHSADAVETAQAEPKDAEAATELSAGTNKLMGILAYLGVLVLIPLLMARNDKFVRFHVNQGLILLICGIVISFAGGILPFLWVLYIATFVLMVIGIINVVKGETKKLPLVGNFRILS